MQIPPFTLERQFQEIGSDIEEAVMKVLKGGQYIGGQEIAEFEENFASSARNITQYGNWTVENSTLLPDYLLNKARY